MTHGQASITTLLGGLLKNRHLVPSMRRVMVMSLWEQVVGKTVAVKSWPERMDDGVLVVGVCSHAWANELDVLRPKILARYRQLLGRSVLKDVQFHVTRRKARQDADHPLPTPLHPEPHQLVATAPVPETLLDGVSNPEVRDLLGPVFARLRAAREWKQEQGWKRCPSCARIYHGTECPYCDGGQSVA